MFPNMQSFFYSLKFVSVAAVHAATMCCLVSSSPSHPLPSQKPSKECEPYAYHENKPIAPCGAIANSMFNGETVSCSADQTQLIAMILRIVSDPPPSL